MRQKKANIVLITLALLVLILLLRGKSQTGRPIEVPPPTGEWESGPLPGPQPEGPFYRDYACNTGLPGICASGTMHCVLPCRECAPTSCSSCVPTNMPAEEICDQLDNNCDGQTDEGCRQPQCSDGIDNEDRDVIVDYPNERNTGCESTLDDSETAGICDDNIDDPSDADRFGDRLDLGCESFADQSEISGQCDDLLDNEGDGVRDYPADPDCTSYADDENEVCSGVDSDNDGFYNGPGCGTAIDCRDDDPNINPGATEICDCRDNNCDGNADETLPIVSGSLDAVVRMVQGTDVMGIQFTLHSCDDAVIYDEYARLVPPNWIDIINDNDPHRLIYAALDFNPANPMTIDAPFDTTIFSYDYVNTCRPTAASFPLSEEIITEWYLDYEDYPRERTVNGPGLFEVSVR